MALSRRSKIILLIVLLPIVLVAIVIAAAFSSAVQTFAARKVLADQGGAIERVDVGLGGASLRGLKIEQPGLTLSVPDFRAEAPLADLAGGKIEVRSLVARDIVVEIDPEKLQSAPPSGQTTSAEPAKPFDGVLNAAELPELRVDGIDIAGRIRVLGAQPLDATFALTGGGIRAGQAGKLELKVEAKSAAGSVVTVFALTPTLGADGRLDALGAVADALATSKLLAQPAKLRAKVDITRQGAGEAYALRMLAGEKPLVELDASWAPGATELPGRWKIAIGDEDIAPFVLNLPLPGTAVLGEGKLSVQGSERLALSGDLGVALQPLETRAVAVWIDTLTKLGYIKNGDTAAAEQALHFLTLGPVSLASKFAVEARATEAKIDTLQLDVKGDSPVLVVRTAQPFSVALDTQKIAPSRAGADLAEVSLLGVPAAWIKAFVPDLALSGPVTGAWAVRPEGDGFSVTSSQPLVATGVTYSSAGQPLVKFDAVRVENVRAKQTSAGLEATVGAVRVIAGDADLVTVKLDATQTAGAPLLAKGEVIALLAKLADQPVLRGQTRLSAGQATITFDASVADALKAAAQVRIAGLRAAGAGDLPEMALDLDVAKDATGVLVVKAPLTVRNVTAKRSSDLLLQATVTPGKTETNIAAKIGSQVLYVEDLQVFAALAAQAQPQPASKPATKPAQTPAPAPGSQAPAGPLWSGTTGEIELALARIVYAPGVEITDTQGRIALTRDTAALEKLRILLGTGGSLDAKGALTWVPAEKGYTLGADVKGAGVAVGPLLKAFAPGEAAKLDGTYDLNATVAGKGSDPAAAASGAAADFKLTGKQGVIRAINLDTNKYAKASNVVSGLAGLAGALSGNEEVAKRANQITAFNAVARSLANLAYDEIAIEAKRAPDGSVEIGKMNLFSQQLRLAGGGSLRAVPGRSFAEMPLNLKLELGAKGDFAKNLEALRVLDAPAADAVADAYRAMSDPLVFDGTLQQVGTAQVSRLLTKALGL